MKTGRWFEFKPGWMVGMTVNQLHCFWNFIGVIRKAAELTGSHVFVNAIHESAISYSLVFIDWSDETMELLRRNLSNALAGERIRLNIGMDLDSVLNDIQREMKEVSGVSGRRDEKRKDS